MNPDTNSLPPQESSDPSAADAAAVDWIRRREAGLTADERVEFRAWLAADRKHPLALAKADTKADEFDWMWHTGTMDLVAAGLETRARKRRWRRTATAVGGLTALIAAGYFWPALRTPAPDLLATSHTVVSLPVRQVLPDGSVVELKDGARITVAFSDALRRVELSNGSAYFAVAKNRSRPFLVQASGVQVQAVGTAFAVQLGQQAVEVLVTEGRVAVNRTRDPSETFGGGERASTQSHRVFVDAGSTVAIPISPVTGREMVVQAVSDAERVEKLDWREPRLGFSGTPLSEVVAMMNRYNRVQFVISDRSLDHLELSGVLRADRVDALVQLLESDFGLRADRRGDAEIVLSQPP